MLILLIIAMMVGLAIALVAATPLIIWKKARERKARRAARME